MLPRHRHVAPFFALMLPSHRLPQVWDCSTLVPLLASSAAAPLKDAEACANLSLALTLALGLTLILTLTLALTLSLALTPTLTVTLTLALALALPHYSL
jgi:hypothetical protein